jgi:predicted transposase YbfD/YdcC
MSALGGASMSWLSITEHFAELPDPRVERTRHHALLDILLIALCAVICGADSFVEIQEWGRAREAWLKERLELSGGIPSHDTFNRVFARLDPEAFSRCFLAWTSALQRHLLAARSAASEGALGAGDQAGSSPAPEVVALDGKRLRRSFDRASGQGALHLVSAWATQQRLVLGQVKVAEPGNEITALPELLTLLDLEGCLVTIDAIGCQRELVRRMVEQGADYVLPVKENQPALREDVQLFLDDALEQQFRGVEHQFHETFDAEHGRQERRRYWITGEVEWLRERHQKEGADRWMGLRSIGMVETRRREGGPGTPESRERRYYISSLPATQRGSAALFARAVRAHWGIENGMHWLLDVVFREDDCRVRKDHAPQNLARLRHLALNLLRQEKSAKVGVKARRLRAAWDLAYLEKVLAS